MLPAQAVDTMAGRHIPQMEDTNDTPIRTYGTRYVEEYFGGCCVHAIPGHGIPYYLPTRLDSVTSFPRPCTVQSLQEFLDMVNFYNRFLQTAL